MIEIFSDVTTLWASVVMTVLFFAATTKANLLFIEWELRSGWKKHFLVLNDQEPVALALIHHCSMQYKPKIPSTKDHNNQDDEEATLFVFA
ncbi:hypothetical protein [Halalkalibacter akibai]|uniref:Uncharacterized protein n=1 Tax=Halalkalibacter akibai (strain ATCC 43226 / DSM 21942 / CIP 109018 / JCM 9157 / 1139) TaxID=1236973 RepID=W4QU21_HALA3|nr:hypothetical protein [Halalkalibacter akibai]GAE35665.1 hypothetical protein JCM9157_2782 [Halalkalibacter akibai JCM 9157]